MSFLTRCQAWSNPSEAQLSFAGSRHKAGIAHFQRGDAMALPFVDGNTLMLVLWH